MYQSGACDPTLVREPPKETSGRPGGGGEGLTYYDSVMVCHDVIFQTDLHDHAKHVVVICSQWDCKGIVVSVKDYCFIFFLAGFHCCRR